MKRTFSKMLRRLKRTASHRSPAHADVRHWRVGDRLEHHGRVLVIQAIDEQGCVTATSRRSGNVRIYRASELARDFTNVSLERRREERQAPREA